MKPLNYSDWLNNRASNRQRKSPQWESTSQRYNYYKCYCFGWMDRNPGKGNTFQILFQATYSPYLSELLGRPNPFLHLLGKAENVGSSWCMPVILGSEHGVRDDET